MARIRHELPSDHAGVRLVHERAFGQTLEGRLVDALRSSTARRISLVADVDGQIVGHIYFSPVSIEPPTASLAGMGLAPLAVLPEYQRTGIGTDLVREGLEECRRLDADFAVVLGHSDYYPRFGFVRASTKCLRCEYPERFMVVEFRSGVLRDVEGLVKYRPEFAFV